MSSDGSCLGVCYADNHLFYSVNDPEKENHLKHIGSIDFNFDVQNAIITGGNQGFAALKTSLETLKETFGCTSVKILSPATEECWSIVPRAVYEDSSEREAHLSLLMQGFERNEIETVWHPVSNVDYKLILLRNTGSMQGFNHLLGAFPNAEYVSEFEIGADWQTHSNANGSFLMIHCTKQYISASSYILGKLRGCTFIRYDNASDLPYLWALYAGKLSWMQGIHEEIYVFGHYSSVVTETLTPYWDDSGEVIVMKSLDAMGLDANEKTYGFRLESVFPAIMMSLNLDAKLEEPA
ncbi:MAG: hypothetical protein EA390_01440 [Balneolaceae bacterium]|nr:MAG: hypothetical protein EA390_01440 [Balneolaceae bacterium]